MIVTPPLADALKERGIAFLDEASNTYLNHPPLLVWVRVKDQNKN